MTQPSILIEHLMPTESNIIQESQNDGKDCWLSGVFMQAEVKNRNGRYYSLQEMNAAVNQAQQIIKETNGIFGELDHPDKLTINLDRVSHVITELNVQGNDVYGRAKLLSTPMGNIAKVLHESGARYGVSSRGAGVVAEDGTVSGFSLVTVDLVATPSAAGAMPAMVYESLEANKHGREAIKLAEHVKHDPVAQRYLKEEILKFLCESTFQKRK